MLIQKWLWGLPVVTELISLVYSLTIVQSPITKTKHGQKPLFLIRLSFHVVCFPTAPALIGFILHENNQHHTVQM